MKYHKCRLLGAQNNVGSEVIIHTCNISWQKSEYFKEKKLPNRNISRYLVYNFRHLKQ